MQFSKVVFIRSDENAPNEAFFTSDRGFVAECLGDNPVVYERLCVVFNDKALDIIKNLLTDAKIEFKIDP